MRFVTTFTKFALRWVGIDLGESGLALAFASVTFAKIDRSDSGEYSVSASNYASGSPSQQIGNGTGRFSLDAIHKFNMSY